MTTASCHSFRGHWFFPGAVCVPVRKKQSAPQCLSGNLVHSVHADQLVDLAQA